MSKNVDNSRCMQQVKIPPEVLGGIKLLASHNDAATMKETYDAAIEWFFQSRAKKRFHYYLASPANGKYTSMWIRIDLVEKCKVIAIRDSTNVSRIIYTALILYLEDNNVL